MFHFFTTEQQQLPQKQHSGKLFAPNDTKEAVRRHAQGITAPETTKVVDFDSKTPILTSMAGQTADENGALAKPTSKVLDHNARLYFDLDPVGKTGTSNLYSFYSEYMDYLDDRDLIDVSIQRQPRQREAHQFFFNNLA